MSEKTQEELRINSSLTIDKAAKLPEGQFDAILSTEDLDNHGEKVSIKGIQIPKKTIRMYWNHDKYGTLLPIGQWIKVSKSGGKLVGRGQIDMEDEFAVKVYKKILAGIVDSISIGFKALEYDTREDMWTKSILTEASVVSEPANEQALITNKSLGFTPKEFDKALTVKLKSAETTDEAPENPPEPITPPVIDESSNDSADITTAIEELKSRLGAVEQAQIAAADNPSIVNKIQVRLAGKEVDKSAEVLNRIIKVTLKG